MTETGDRRRIGKETWTRLPVRVGNGMGRKGKREMEGVEGEIRVCFFLSTETKKAGATAGLLLFPFSNFSPHFYQSFAYASFPILLRSPFLRSPVSVL